MEDVIIDQLQPEDIPEAARVLSYSLVSDPASIALWKGEGEDQRRKIEAVIRDLDLNNSHAVAFVARQGGRILGVVNLVEWPHHQKSFVESIKLLPTVLTLYRGAIFREYQLYSALSRLEPKEPHWRIGPLGVLPEMQMRGIGSKLIERYIQFLDQRHEAALGETTIPQVMKYHERLGFYLIGEVPVLGVHYWMMWRSAH